jgi:hypothetical protein
MPRINQLAQARNAEARGQHLVLDAAAQCGGHAHHQVHAVLLLQRRPAVDDVAVVLRRLGQPRRVVDAVVIEEHALHLVPLGDGGAAKLYAVSLAWCV